MAAGASIGHEREIAGLHYPSDARASSALGEALFERLEKNETFLKDVDAARAEWRGAMRADYGHGLLPETSYPPFFR